ncbi:MAG: bifunctional adenosylcobinamide kinase/adenosylcobinamide-phosphate guanylyltransferase [Campylobacterota bacterium]|nr:bifunctional adenosylcobinamide kinase/adenosylcobinamide-phosphate guanylyltransferase [Campylobacterota bacterium]
MKILYFGGQKSGKSRLAEQKALQLSNAKPYYIATYDNSYDDKEMGNRIKKHQNQREEKFITIEETKDLPKVIEDTNTYLVDCISMWILNHIETSEEELIEQIDTLDKTKANIVFVLNDVSSGIIPLEYQSRRFVDMSGIIGQKLASICDEVYEVKIGIGVKIK